MKIPMVDLKIQYQGLKDEIEEGIRQVLDSTRFILGPNVQSLEEEVAAYCGVRNAVGVASGTDALHLALRACGIRPGDEVITSPFTFIATAEAISYIGAKPVFVDIDPRTFNVDPDLIEEAITDRTRAIIPVHLFGQPADMESITDLARKHSLRVIEDCAQSFGADYGQTKTGALGDAGCFSFFPSKNLGCYGDGGMVVTDDDAVAEEVRVLRNHGSRVQYHHSIIGYNSRLDEVQAVILRAKLKHIDTYNRLRYYNASRYTEALSGTELTPPFEDGKGTHVYHQYTIMSDSRDVLHRALGQSGIASAVYYPIPLHRQEVYREEWRELTLPVSEETAAKVLSLPIFPELSEAQIDEVCATLTGAL